MLTESNTVYTLLKNFNEFYLILITDLNILLKELANIM
jgi:hypothetical protein